MTKWFIPKRSWRIETKKRVRDVMLVAHVTLEAEIVIVTPLALPANAVDTGLLTDIARNKSVSNTCINNFNSAC